MRLFVGILMLLSLCAGPAFAATEEAKMDSIDKGLAWLATTQQIDGDEGYWYYSNDGTLAATAAVLLAFLEEGYLPGMDVVIDSVNYGDVTGYAARYVFNRATSDTRFGIETDEYERYAEDYNNDGNYENDGGNNQAIFFDPGAYNRNVYTTGIVVPVVYTLGKALGIETILGYGSAVVENSTYGEIMQDLIDWFCFAQVEPSRGVYRGGWRYDANWENSDNSTAQWGALPLLYANSWGLGTPQYVKDELTLWADYIQNDQNGGSGYSNPNDLVNISKTGGLLLEFAAIGRAIDHESVQAALAYIDSRWNTTVSGWDGNLNNAYAMWAIYKALEVYGLTDYLPYGPGEADDVMIGFGIPSAPGEFTIGWQEDPETSLPGDWYSHYCDYLVGIQNQDGSWSGAESWTGPLATGWYVNIVNAGGAPPMQCVTATVEEPLYGEEHLTIPISLSNVEAQQAIYGVDITFTFDPEILVPADVTLQGTLPQELGWGYMYHVPSGGEVRVGLAGSEPIEESGMLIYLEFEIAENAPCGGITPLELDILLNEGEPCVDVNGAESWQMPMQSIIGNVSYWACGSLGNDYPPIPGVMLHLAGNPPDSVETDAAGNYELGACYDSCYVVTPSRPGGEIEGISVLDAALILRYVVGLETLDECPIQPMVMWDGSLCPPEPVLSQQVAGEVSGDGEIHSYDASLVLRYLVGSAPQESEVGCWDFYCDSRECCVLEDVTYGIDFVGLLKGDVSGNYGLTAPRQHAPQSEADLTVGMVTGGVGESVEVPIVLTGGDGFYGMHFGVAFDPEYLEIEAVVPTELGNNALLEWNAESGDLLIACASLAGFYGDGEICRVQCRINAPPPGGFTTLDLHDARADEDPGFLGMTDGGIYCEYAEVVWDRNPADRFLLQQPVPNPGLLETTVRFHVPTGGDDVEIQVLDISGRVVATLVDEVLAAGFHTVAWEGVDQSGQPVSSGSYFVRLRAKGFEETKKVALIQ